MTTIKIQALNDDVQAVIGKHFRSIAEIAMDDFSYEASHAVAKHLCRFIKATCESDRKAAVIAMFAANAIAVRNGGEKIIDTALALIAMHRQYIIWDTGKKAESLLNDTASLKKCIIHPSTETIENYEKNHL